MTGRSSNALSAKAFWGWAAFIGFLCGLAESGVSLIRQALGHWIGNPDLWANWHAPWLAPLSLATWFAGFGIVATLARVAAPRTVNFLATYIFVALGALSALRSLDGLSAWGTYPLAAGLATRLASSARPDSGSFLRRVRAVLPWAAGVWGILFVTTGLIPAVSETRGLARGPSPPPNAPNVLLVVLDTVRADHLGLGGYERSTSPRLDAWSRRGIRFDQARASSSFTLGTHASLFTGRRMFETSARANVPLDSAHLTLAEHLRDRGYATGGFVGNIFYGSAHYGLDRGFLHYHDVPGNITRRVTIREFFRACRLGASLITWFERKQRILVPMQRLRLDAGEINREALAWIDATRTFGRPYFLFLNYFDAHSPYSLPAEAPQPFASTSVDRLEALMKRMRDLESRLAERFDPRLDNEVTSLREEIRPLIRDAYDDGIAWIDRKFDELLGELSRRGLMENTLVVVTSDHGELLGEHEMFGHGNSLHKPLVHVPLLMVGGERLNMPRDVTIQRPVSVRDVPASILDLIGDPNPDRFPGRSLRRYWADDRRVGEDEVDDPVLSELEHMPWLPEAPWNPSATGALRLLTEGRWSYHRREGARFGIEELLFDLELDPGEEHDLSNDPSGREPLNSLRANLSK